MSVNVAENILLKQKNANFGEKFQKNLKIKINELCFFLMLRWQYVPLIGLFNKMSMTSTVCFFYVCGWTNTAAYL